MYNVQLPMRALLVSAIVNLFLLPQPALAAPAKAPVKIGTVYTKASTPIPLEPYDTRIVEIILPAGKYIVTGSGTVRFQNGGVSPYTTVNCNVYAWPVGQLVDATKTTGVQGAYSPLVLNGVAILTTDGFLRAECNEFSGLGSVISIQLNATTAADVIAVP